MADQWQFFEPGASLRRQHNRHHDEKLHVVAVISNPVRYKSRVRLYHEFEKHMNENPKVILHVVEAAFGNRPHEIADETNPNHVLLRTNHEIWHKENMINIGFQNVVANYPHAKYIAWIDADIEFTRKDWAEETIEQLQHHQVVQMWSHAVDLGPNHETIGNAKSFASYYVTGAESGDPKKYGYWHSGYAWAARRTALDELGGLIDFAILGSADFYMAWAMIGQLGKNLYNDVHNIELCKRGFNRRYIDKLFEWQARAEGIQLNLGCVHGTVLHFFHGRKIQRGYNTREAILITNDYDPNIDLKHDAQGLWQLVVKSPRQIKMRDQIRRYFRKRNEDSIDVE